MNFRSPSLVTTAVVCDRKKHTARFSTKQQAQINWQLTHQIIWQIPHLNHLKQATCKLTRVFLSSSSSSGSTWILNSCPLSSSSFFSRSSSSESVPRMSIHIIESLIWVTSQFAFTQHYRAKSKMSLTRGVTHAMCTSTYSQWHSWPGRSLADHWAALPSTRTLCPCRGLWWCHHGSGRVRRSGWPCNRTTLSPGECKMNFIKCKVR